jgi:hypothetical protein
MRFIALFACIFAGCLWGQAGNADIYVWTDDNDVMHFSNEDPPPQAEVFMQTIEISHDDAADNRQELQQTQAQLLEEEARLEEQRAEEERQIAEAEQRAIAARQAQAEIDELEERLAEQQAAADRRIAEDEQRAQQTVQYAQVLPNSISYAHYSKRYSSPYYRFSSRHYRSPAVICCNNPNKFRNGRCRYQRPHLNKNHFFQNRFTVPKLHHRGIHQKFDSGRHPSFKSRFKDDGSSRFRHLRDGRGSFHLYFRSGSGKR